MAVSKTHTGWRRDEDNSRLDFYYEGTRVGSISGSTFTVASGIVLSLPTDSIDSADYAATSIDKEHLASEIYTIEHILFTARGVDSQTHILSRMWSAGTVVRVTYYVDTLLPTGTGIDVIDGGANGSGTDVIDSCDDTLAADTPDNNDLTTPYALSAGDYIGVIVDNIDADTLVSVDIQIKVPIGAAT